MSDSCSGGRAQTLAERLLEGLHSSCDVFDMQQINMGIQFLETARNITPDKADALCYVCAAVVFVLMIGMLCYVRLRYGMVWYGMA